MIIAIYGEPLKVPTSANPGRGMLIELIRRRQEDWFVFFFHSEVNSSVIMTSFFQQLKFCKNWEIKICKKNRFLRILNLLSGTTYTKLSFEADLFLNPDCTSLGKECHPLITTIADFSVFKGFKYASFRNPISYVLRKKIISKGIQDSDRISSISNSTFNELKGYFPNEAFKVRLVYNGIDNAWFVPTQKKADIFKYWIWWGHISKRKNLESMLLAYSILIKKENQEVPLFKIIYNNSKFPKGITKLINKLQISNKIIVERSKPLTELIDEVSKSAGLLFASKVEGFGLPIIEAMATGIPVLTSNCSAMNEVGGNHAIFCNPFDINSMVNGMMHLLDNSNYSNEKIEKRKGWARNFTYSKAAERYYLILSEFSNKK